MAEFLYNPGVDKKMLHILFLSYYMSKNPNSNQDALFVRLRETGPFSRTLQVE